MLVYSILYVVNRNAGSWIQNTESMRRSVNCRVILLDAGNDYPGLGDLSDPGG